MEAGDDGTETIDSQMGGGPHVGEMLGIGLGVEGGEEGDRSGDRGREAAIEADKAGKGT